MQPVFLQLAFTPTGKLPVLSRFIAPPGESRAAKAAHIQNVFYKEKKAFPSAFPKPEL